MMKLTHTKKKQAGDLNTETTITAEADDIESCIKLLDEAIELTTRTSVVFYPESNSGDR